MECILKQEYQQLKLGLEMGSSGENTGKKINTIVSPTSVAIFFFTYHNLNGFD